MKQLLFFILVLSALQAYAQQPHLLQERNYLTNNSEKNLLTSSPIGNGKILFSGITLTNSISFNFTYLLVNQFADSLWTRKGLQSMPGTMQVLCPTTNSGALYGSASKSTVAPTVGYYVMYLQKLNALGQVSWTKNINTVAGDVHSIVALPDKGFLLGGAYGLGKTFSIVRTDSLGSFKNSRNYTRSNRDNIIDMQVAPNGNIIAAGNTAGLFLNTWHPKLLLLNQNGDSLLGKTLVITGQNRKEGMGNNFNSVTPLSDGGYLLTSYTDTVNAVYPNGTYLGMVVKVDANLNLQWKYIYRNPATDYYMFTKAKELADGTILVLGFKYLPTQGGNGFQLYHFSPLGQLLNTYPFTSNICSQVWGVTLDALSDSTYLVGGRCGNNPPITYGFYVAKVKIPGLPLPKPPITITGTSKELAVAGFTLGQSYPNPASETAVIPFNLPNSYKQANIIIRDITGRQVGNYTIKKSSSSLEVSLSNFRNGLYTYTLLVDENPVATKKLVVLK